MTVAEGLGTDILTSLLDTIRFDDRGLVTAVAQQYDSGEVLMVAWMTRATILETLETGRVCYWSRSRGERWRKGDTSGHHQWLRGMRLDCDGDTLLLLVDQKGPACHTGRRSCFFRAVDGPSPGAEVEPLFQSGAPTEQSVGRL